MIGHAIHHVLCTCYNQFCNSVEECSDIKCQTDSANKIEFIAYHVDRNEHVTAFPFYFRFMEAINSISVCRQIIDSKDTLFCQP